MDMVVGWCLLYVHYRYRFSLMADSNSDDNEVNICKLRNACDARVKCFLAQSNERKSVEICNTIFSDSSAYCHHIIVHHIYY
jgi:hypothetical protein